jgi:hypothetical protein
MTVTELHQKGVINYLFNNGIVSHSILLYIAYSDKFVSYRQMGKTYREAVELISQEFNVSETTVKKAVRLVINE